VAVALTLFAVLALLAALDGEEGVEVLHLAVVAGEVGDRVVLALQRSLELTRRPFLPPCISRVNLVTGASGTASKVFLIRPPTESMRPSRSMLIWLLWRAATRSGSWCSEDLR
jgi:hypothetical protein